MATHGKKTRVLVNGYDLSRFFRSASIDGEVELLDTTTFQASAKTYIIGMPDSKASLEGLFSSNADALAPNEVDDILQPILGTDSELFVLIAQGDIAAVGDACQLFSGRETKYSVTSPFNGVTSCMAEIQADNGIRAALALAGLAARTATGAGASVDNAVATAAGFHASLHVTEASAADTLDVIIEDSADGSTWATIGTFPQVSAIGAERLEIAGAVRRYVRASWTIAGTSPSFTFAVGFARLLF